MIHDFKSHQSSQKTIRLSGIPLVDLSFLELAELYRDYSSKRDHLELIAVEKELQRRDEIYLKNNWRY